MSARILVVGGTGMIGSHAAAHLAARGDSVTVLARQPAAHGDPPTIAGMLRLVGDYTGTDLVESDLEQFDAIVFAAGQDVRHIPEDAEDAALWDRVQARGVPAFATLARAAGVGRFVQVGSCYHQLMPDLAETVPYVAARRDADERTRALSDEGFAAITLNPPSVVGTTPGRGVRRFARILSGLRGELPDGPVTVPPGGTNYLSARSLAEAIAGALDRGKAGRAYLVGDENLRYREFFQLLADAAGIDYLVHERDEPSPWQPDRFMVQGRGTVVAYEPDPAEVQLLGYRRHDIRRAVEEVLSMAEDARRAAAGKEGSR